MTGPMATVREMVVALEGLDPSVPVGFATEAGVIGGNYHITELKLAEVHSIDCGGRQSRWRETAMQLLDGHGAGWIAAGKAAAILKRSVEALPGVEDAPLSIEFAHGNGGLGRYSAGGLEARDGKAIVPLVPQRAQCKPAQEMACCPPDAAKGQCCDSAAV